MRIKVLPDTVINQIAAGEVVERPVSVVRELVDNAVDAGATDIFVAVEGGGHSRIKVRDNGCGMSKDEAILAFERHATSKVTSLDDLLSLGTLGFRGEALASIASVSKVQLRTRARESDIGTLVVFRGGKLTDVQSLAWNQGTEIEVEHLFFNTPARRKFLKSPRSEVARIRTWIAHSGLARPAVRYRFVSDGDEILHLHPVASVAERAQAVFAPGLIPISLSEGGLHVQGMISHPGQALADTSGFVVLVNGRLVSDKIVQRAVREGYDSMLKDREYPVGYLSIDLPGEDVDVNVHPQKSEVRFRHPQQVFAVVQGAVLTGVRSIRRAAPVYPTATSIPVVSQPRSQPFDARPESFSAESAAVASEAHEMQLYQPQALFSRASDMPSAVSFASPQGVAERRHGYDPKLPAERILGEDLPFYFSDLRYVGQVLECYLVCEHDGSLVVVDMHAAHERVNYNKIRAARAAREVATQKLLLPETIRLTEEQVVHLIEQVEVLEALGFEISQTSPDTIAVHGVPAIVSHVDCVSLLKECAAEPLSAGWKERIEERVDHITARIACHASVRSGDLITRQEVYALFSQLDEAQVSGACPHGRPVVVHFCRDAVERWFGRDR
jgi:DNA mismatch repair protein MutL